MFWSGFLAGSLLAFATVALEKDWHPAAALSAVVGALGCLFVFAYAIYVDFLST